MIPTFKEFLLTEGSSKLDKALKLYLDKWYSGDNRPSILADISILSGQDKIETKKIKDILDRADDTESAMSILKSINEARIVGDPNFFLPNGIKWVDFKPGVKISFYFGGTSKAEAEITKVDGDGKSTKVTAKIYRTNGRRIYDPKPEKLTLTDLSNIYDITFKR